MKRDNNTFEINVIIFRSKERVGTLGRIFRSYFISEDEQTIERGS